MFKVIDGRDPKLELGMVINEFINGNFTREFIIGIDHDYREIEMLEKSGKDDIPCRIIIDVSYISFLEV